MAGGRSSLGVRVVTQEDGRDGGHSDRHDAAADPLVPRPGPAGSLESLERIGVCFTRGIWLTDRAADPRSGASASLVEVHASSSSIRSRRASSRRPSNRCFFTVPGAMSRIAATSATGRSSR